MASRRRDQHGRFHKAGQKPKTLKWRFLINQSNKNTNDILGRRIVDLNVFGVKFDKGCQKCGNGLRFVDIIREVCRHYSRKQLWTL